MAGSSPASADDQCRAEADGLAVDVTFRP